MNSPRLAARLGTVFLTVFFVFTLWQTPSLWRSPLTSEEVNHFAALLEANLNLPDQDKRAFIARVSQWARTDDGAPVLLVNLMQYRSVPDRSLLPSSFEGSSEDANAYYERIVVPLAVRQGEYPLMGGAVQAGSLTSSREDGANWDRVAVMRAPSRRAFLQFMSDPEYGAVAAYKLAAAEVAIFPVDADVTVPDLRALLGLSLLALYFFILWRRALRTSKG